MLRKTALVFFGVLSVTLGWRVTHPVASEGALDASLLPNHVWVQRMPRDDRDMVLQAVPMDIHGDRVGVALVASAYRILIEVFTWKLEGSKLSLEFPQDMKKASVQVKTWKCVGSAPEPFELCMELGEGRKALKMYSREDWVVDPDTGTAPNAPLALSALPRLKAQPCVDCVDGLPSWVGALTE